MVSSVGDIDGERLEEVWRHAQPESVVREHQSGVGRDGELSCARLHKVGVAANRLSGLKTIQRKLCGFFFFSKMFSLSREIE